MLLIASLIALFYLPEPWNVLVVVAAATIEVAEVYFWIHFLRRYRVRGGVEGMIGQRAEAIEICAPEGRVRVRGEIWRARMVDQAVLAVGDRAWVSAVDGLLVELVSTPADRDRAARFTGSEGA